MNYESEMNDQARCCGVSVVRCRCSFPDPIDGICVTRRSSPLPSCVCLEAWLHVCFLSHWKPSKPTALIGLQVLIHYAAPTLSGLTEIPQARGPSFGLRALWMGWVVNHCQRHISVCLGAERSWASQTNWGMTSKCWEISETVQLLTLTHYSADVYTAQFSL